MDPTKPPQNNLLPADQIGTDTGTGGFEIGGKLQTYDVGVVSDKQSSVDFSHGSLNVKKGFTGPNGKPADISNGTKRTLADYLSNLTRGKEGQPDGFIRRPNTFTVGEVGQDYNEISLVGPNGVTPQINTEGPWAKPADSPAMTSKSDNVQATGFDKFAPGGSSVALDAINGNGLLRDAAPKNIDGKFMTQLVDSTPVEKYTTSLLNNRFNSLQSQGGSIDALYESKNADINSKQFVRGYDKGSSALPTGHRLYSMAQLAQVGTVLGIRASGERGANNAGMNSSDKTTEAEAILPGLAQIGVTKIRSSLLEAKDVIDNLAEDAAIGPEQLVNIDDNTFGDGSGSWGTLNNVFDQYSGASNVGMMLLSLSLLVGIEVIVGGFSELLFLITKPSDPKSNEQAVTQISVRLPIGSSSVRGGTASIGNTNVDIYSLLNIARTKNNYFLCVRTGVAAFFGLGDLKSGEDIGKAAAAALTTSLLNPEHPVVQARAFTRSFLVIADALKGVVSAFKSNPTAGTKQILNFANVIVHSKFIGALNTFATLGDSVLSFNEKWIDKDATGGFGRKVSAMDMDEMGVSAADSVSKNRLKNSLRLSWSSSETYNSLILPSGYDRERFTPKIKNPYRKDSDIRISSKHVDAIEEALDSDYLPFYFHDLRTNEFVSFHAFLSSLGESYTSSYDTVEAFGRVDPIKIYKNTHRKIDFSFYVAATSEEDFEFMWIKINKLITLLYPQYTEGKQIVTEDIFEMKDEFGDTAKTQNFPVTFYSPFSQQISASPMIRLRIGDLISSNFSKFNLAKLFGHTNPNSSLNESQNSLDAAAFLIDPQEYLGELTAKSLQLGTLYTLKEEFLPGENEWAKDAYRAIVYELYILVSGEIRGNFSVRVSTADELKKQYPDWSDKKIQSAINRANELYNVNQESSIRLEWSKMDVHAVSNEKYSREIWSQWANAHSEEIKSYLQKNSTKNFFDSKNNSIVKSFDSVKGKGLPGFIESMSFDWHDRVTWSVSEPSRSKAPKMCKITISFTPIHDISPGIDFRGFNRAPVYPVETMRRDDMITSNKR